MVLPEISTSQRAFSSCLVKGGLFGLSNHQRMTSYYGSDWAIISAGEVWGINSILCPGFGYESQSRQCLAVSPHFPEVLHHKSILCLSKFSCDAFVCQIFLMSCLISSFEISYITISVVYFGWSVLVIPLTEGTSSMEFRDNLENVPSCEGCLHGLIVSKKVEHECYVHLMSFMLTFWNVQCLQLCITNRSVGCMWKERSGNHAEGVPTISMYTYHCQFRLLTVSGLRVLPEPIWNYFTD